MTANSETVSKKRGRLKVFDEPTSQAVMAVAAFEGGARAVQNKMYAVAGLRALYPDGLEKPRPEDFQFSWIADKDAVAQGGPRR